MFVITGGGSGIGKALALELASRGKNVLIAGRREEVLVEVAASHALVDYLVADVASPEGRVGILARLQACKMLDGLIHNAGTIEPIQPIAEVSLSAWQQTMATNVEAPLFLTQKLKDKLIHRRVLHIGSGAAYFPVVGWSAYCVSKAALAMLTRCWQLESPDTYFASVMPGIIDTPMQARIREAQTMDPEKLIFFQKLKDQEQLLSPETVAQFLSWLLLEVKATEYVAQEWDIYDTQHHKHWLNPPYSVPYWE